MKKIISVLLCLVMILGMSTTAFAEGNTTANVTIDGDVSRTFHAYQLMELTITVMMQNATVYQAI